jgi:crotonobetainyl-CoA:carnitine CoA-transferase CaiB-like acyl-CoA transferase
MRANGYITTVTHPTFGPTDVVGVPVRLSDTPGTLRHPAPEFGQHTEEILTGLLGYSWEDVGRLRDAEVI